MPAPRRTASRPFVTAPRARRSRLWRPIQPGSDMPRPGPFTSGHRIAPSWGSYPSGQRERTVNPPALPSEVRILPPPPSAFYERRPEATAPLGRTRARPDGPDAQRLPPCNTRVARLPQSCRLWPDGGLTTSLSAPSQKNRVSGVGNQPAIRRGELDRATKETTQDKNIAARGARPASGCPWTRREVNAVQAAWSAAGPEPALDELLHDPIVELLMRRDRISRQDILCAVQHARQRLESACPQPEALAS